MDETQPLLEPPPGSNVVCPEQQDADGKVVDFDPNGDPENPLEWPRTYKWGIVCLQAFMAFTVTFTCISVVPVANHIVDDVSGGHSSKEASVLLVTIWELGEAAGPLLIAPLSEVYGRYPIFNGANLLFIGGIVISALSQSTGVLIFARFLTGCAVASNVLNPAIIGDMFVAEERGSAMSLVMLAPLTGGAVGPAIAGAIAQSTGWRQIMWMSLILAGVSELMFLTLFRETYKVPILQKKAARLCKDRSVHPSKMQLVTSIEEGVEKTESAVLTAIGRPLKVFLDSSVLQGLSLYGAVMFSFFYVLSTSLPDILQSIYDFPPALIGTAFLSFSVGSVCGIIICNVLIDRIYKKLQRKYSGDGKPRPENRLPLVITGAFCMPLVVALYGWTAQQQWPVAVLILSVALQGLCCMLGIVPVMAYVVDAFGLYSASALTAVLITRCLMGTFLPLAAAPLAAKLGYGFGFMILGAIALVLAPTTIFVMRYGGRWRQKSQYTRDK